MFDDMWDVDDDFEKTFGDKKSANSINPVFMDDSLNLENLGVEEWDKILHQITGDLPTTKDKKKDVIDLGPETDNDIIFDKEIEIAGIKKTIKKELPSSYSGPTFGSSSKSYSNNNNRPTFNDRNYASYQQPQKPRPPPVPKPRLNPPQPSGNMLKYLNLAKDKDPLVQRSSPLPPTFSNSPNKQKSNSAPVDLLSGSDSDYKPSNEPKPGPKRKPAPTFKASCVRNNKGGKFCYKDDDTDKMSDMIGKIAARIDVLEHAKLEEKDPKIDKKFVMSMLLPIIKKVEKTMEEINDIKDRVGALEEDCADNKLKVIGNRNKTKQLNDRMLSIEYALEKGTCNFAQYEENTDEILPDINENKEGKMDANSENVENNGDKVDDTAKKISKKPYITCCRKINFDLAAKVQIIEENIFSENKPAPDIESMREKVNSNYILQSRVETLEEEMITVRKLQTGKTSEGSSDLPLEDGNGSEIVAINKEESEKNEKGAEIDSENKDTKGEPCLVRNELGGNKNDNVPSTMILDILEEMEKAHSKNDFVIDYNNNKSFIGKDSKENDEKKSISDKTSIGKKMIEDDIKDTKESANDLENAPIKALVEDVKVKQELEVPVEKYEANDDNEILILSSDNDDDNDEDDKTSRKSTRKRKRVTRSSSKRAKSPSPEKKKSRETKEKKKKAKNKDKIKDKTKDKTKDKGKEKPKDKPSEKRRRKPRSSKTLSKAISKAQLSDEERNEQEDKDEVDDNEAEEILLEIED